MTVSVDGQPLTAGRSRPELPASRLLMVPTRPSAWRSCTTHRNGTMPACRMRSSSPRGATASMAQTIQASARRSPTVASASRCRTPPRSIGLRCSLYATRLGKARRPQVTGLGQKPTTVAPVICCRKHPFANQIANQLCGRRNFKSAPQNAP